MSFLGKALIAATARKNAPARFTDVETYRFGEYDVDLDEYLTSTTQFNSGVAEKYSMYRNGIRPISVNYSSDGLTYYITRQHSSQTTNTTSTAYNQFEVAHLTLSRAHDLRTITSHTNVVVDFSDTEPDAAAAMSRNQRCKISWHNGGYNFTFIGRDSGNATSVDVRGYAFEVTTPYTGIGATKIDEYHDPLFTDNTEFHMSPSGGKAFVFNKGEWFYALTNNSSHGPFKLGNGNRGSQFYNPKRATYWNKIAHMSALHTSYCPARIFCDLTSNPAHIFYPYKTTTSETSSTSSNNLKLQRHTSYQVSNSLNVLDANTTVTEYSLGPMVYNSGSSTTIINLYGHRDYGFSQNGLILYILARKASAISNPFYLLGFNLSTAFDPSSWNGSYTELNFSAVSMNAGGEDEVCAFCFNNRPTYQDSSSASTNAIGTVLYVLRLGDFSEREIYVFSLSTAWDLSTATLREIIPETATGMSISNNVTMSTEAEHKKAMYNSIIMHHPVLDQTGTNRAAESLIVYPQCTATTDEQRPFVVYNDGTGWNYSIKEDANEMVLIQAADHAGVGTTIDWPIHERLYGFSSSSTDMHQLGEPEYETTTSRQQVRRETYYRRIAVYDMDYASQSTYMFLDHNESGVTSIQDSNATLRGGSTGTSRVSWVDSYCVGPAQKFATVTWGAGSSQEALVYVLFQEIADNKDQANTGLACTNRYRLGGVEDVDMDFGQLAAYNGGNQTMNAAPITEIFSPIYTDGYDRIAAMFPVPQVAASGDDPALPARMGFIDDRGYCYYLESMGMKSTGVGSFPLPTAGNHPGGVTTGTAMGNALKYTKTANTISCHALFQDDLTIYDGYQRWQRILDFDFDPTGHVCCVLGTAQSVSNDVRTVFVYYVDKPFSTNKNDWTYLISGSTTSNTNTYRIKIVDGHVFIHDYDNDAMTVSVDVDAILTNGPTYAHPALSFTTPLASSGGSDFLWVDYNIDSVDGPYTYYNSIRADIVGGTIYLYHGQVRALYQSLTGTSFYTAYTTSGQIWWRVNGTATRPDSITYSERGMWYDKTHETFYFVHEATSQNNDSLQRAPLRIYKSKVLDKDENGAGNWLIEEPTPYELKTKLPFQVETFKIFGDKIIFVEWQGRFMGSTRMS